MKRFSVQSKWCRRSFIKTVSGANLYHKYKGIPLFDNSVNEPDIYDRNFLTQVSEHKRLPHTKTTDTHKTSLINMEIETFN